MLNIGVVTEAAKMLRYGGYRAEPTLADALIDEFDRVDAENKKLRKALEPFASIGLEQDADKRAKDMISGPDLMITPGQVREARKVLGHNI